MPVEEIHHKAPNFKDQVRNSHGAEPEAAVKQAATPPSPSSFFKLKQRNVVPGVRASTSTAAAGTGPNFKDQVRNKDDNNHNPPEQPQHVAASASAAAAARPGVEVRASNNNHGDGIAGPDFKDQVMQQHHDNRPGVVRHSARDNDNNHPHENSVSTSLSSRDPDGVRFTPLRPSNNAIASSNTTAAAAMMDVIPAAENVTNLTAERQKLEQQNKFFKRAILGGIVLFLTLAIVIVIAVLMSSKDDNNNNANNNNNKNTILGICDIDCDDCTCPATLQPYLCGPNRECHYNNACWATWAGWDPITDCVLEETSNQQSEDNTKNDDVTTQSPSSRLAKITKTRTPTTIIKVTEPTVPPTSLQPTTTTTVKLPFTNRIELEKAVDIYIQGNASSKWTSILPYGSSINDWDVSQITDLHRVFSGTRNVALQNFTGNLSNWDVSRVQNFNEVFFGATAFTGIGSLDHWNTSSATSMDRMFQKAKSMNANLSQWNISNVRSLRATFGMTDAFQGIGLDQWDTSQVTDLSFCFDNANGLLPDLNLNAWDTSHVANMQATFQAARSFSGSGIEDWNVSQVTDMSYMFYNAIQFNANLTNWDVSNLITTEATFQNAYNFTGIGLEHWETKSLQEMKGMFAHASAFHPKNLSGWDTSRVKSMADLFNRATSFTGVGIEHWNTSQVTDMSRMLSAATALDLVTTSLEHWDMSQVTATIAMFYELPSFLGLGLDQWDVGSVRNMSAMFVSSINFDADLSDWDVSNVESMQLMFVNTTSFRGVGLANWNVSNVQNFENMFCGSLAALNTAQLPSIWNVSADVMNC